MSTAQPYIAIVDYQLSNMFSVKHAFEHLGVPAVITSDPKEVSEASGTVLPGVGAFGDAMANLKKFKLDRALKEFVGSGRPFLGVCLGLQLIFETSSEFGKHKGLGFIAGDVVKFPAYNTHKEKIRVPQIGWNTIEQPSPSIWKKTPFKHLKNHPYMYFVHSYYVRPADTKIITSTTSYMDFSYCSSVLKDNIFATQFHPEKSGTLGIGIYKNWIEGVVFKGR